ncbi:hypothetical protein PG995_004243 [Apiospora arundinis]
MTSNYHQPSFEKVTDGFRDSLLTSDVEAFQSTTLEQLQTRIVTLQTVTPTKLKRLNRLQLFIEVIEQFGKVVLIFYQDDDVFAFIWYIWHVPELKLPQRLTDIKQATSEHHAAFDEVLNILECICDALPRFSQYQDLFRAKPHMVRVLTLMYEDVLKFQRIILRYFQQPRQSCAFSF